MRTALKAAFQKHRQELVEALLALTKSDDERVRLGAIQACFGWGKPAQTMAGDRTVRRWCSRCDSVMASRKTPPLWGPF